MGRAVGVRDRWVIRTCSLASALVLFAAGVYLALPRSAGASSAPRLVTWTIHSRYVDVAKAQFSSPPPGDPREDSALHVDVLLPAGYDGTRRFPVLYLLHGHGDTFQSWTNVEKGDLLDIAKGFPAIVVMPEAAQGWYTNWWDAGQRGADGRAWENYVLDEVIPMVEHQLKVLPGRANHAVAGLSMGGYGAIYLAALLPGYFGSAASFSGVLSTQRPEWPAAFASQGQQYPQVDGDPQGFYATGHNPVALIANLRDTRLFVTVGNGVPLPVYPGELTNTFGEVAEAELSLQAGDFVTAARSVGADLSYHPGTGIHDWPWWRTALREALQWGFFQPVPAAPSDWTYRTVATAGEAWDIGFSFTAPPTSVETFTRRGNQLSGTGTGRVRIQPAAGPAFTTNLPFAVTVS